MSITRQSNFLGNQRLDVPMLRSLESSIANDFDLLAGNIMAAKTALIVSGFNLVMTPTPVGSPATSLLLNVANGVMVHPLATEAGSLFVSPSGRTTERLYASNTRVSGSFQAGFVNYVGIDIRRSADSGTADKVAFLDPISLTETSNVVPMGRTTDYVIIISTVDFSSSPGVCPIAKITTDASNNVSAIADARQMMFRLGSGGSTPNAQNIYAFPQGRYENTSGDIFYGGDKAVNSLKSWMDAVMTRIQETNGGRFWYSPVSVGNIRLNRSGSKLSNGEYLDYTAGTLSWQGLSVLFPNSSSCYYNMITDGSITLSNGECVYVDIDFTSNATVTLQKAPFATLGASTSPGSRFIIACVYGGYAFARDSAWPVGTSFTPATTSALGLVKLSTIPNSIYYPVVATFDTATSMICTAGISRVSTSDDLGPGGILIGNDATSDTSLEVGSSGSFTTLIHGLTTMITNTTGATSLTVSSTSGSGNTVGINSTAKTGIFSTGTAGPGIYATGTTYGVNAVASAGKGVNATGTTYGVNAVASAGIGVNASGTTYGVSGTGGTTGVYGLNSPIGVLGEGTSIGVSGVAASADGIGGSFLGSLSSTKVGYALQVKSTALGTITSNNWSPTVALTDHTGLLRGLVDHNGFTMG